MILKLTAIGLVSAIVWLNGANGASYSKVFVQSGGPDVVPVEYYNYGSPAVTSDPQIARLSAPPMVSVVPVQTVSNVIPPCVSPCVVTPAVASAVPSAKLVSYNAPNVPVVVAPSKDNGYEYSYVVYDENTGDRKAQRELSNGAVVRGEYSFLQPDGYIREVQYRADDVNGFNVVVKNILPDAVGDKRTDNPCTKNEELKVDPGHVQDENDHGHEGHDHTHDDHAQPKEGEVHTPELHVHTHLDHDCELAGPSTEHVHEVKAPTHDALQVIPHIVTYKPEKEYVEEHENVHAPEPEQPSTAEPPHASSTEPEHKHEVDPVTEVTEIVHEIPTATPEVTHQATVEVVDLPQKDPASSIPLISYEEVLRCLQAKGLTQKGLNFSPLTYIILPASNRPC